MYRTINEVPKEKFREIKDNLGAWGIILRDADSKDFERVECIDGKKTFTKENLITEIEKIDSFPDYVLLPSEFGDIHVVYYERNYLTEKEKEEIETIFKETFGIIHCI